MKNRSPGRLGRLFFSAVTLESRCPGSVVINKRNTTDAGTLWAARHSRMTLCDERRSGFTLIELLVVVLIIGILSAIALPQYNRAVAKARAAEAVTLFKQLAVVERAYRLSTGRYNRSLEGMDIQLPNMGGNIGYGFNNFNGKHMIFYVEGGTTPQEGLMGKAYPRQATYQNKQFAVHMTLSTAGLLRLWCTDKYEPNYGFGSSGWSSFNATGEACALCQSISGNRNGLLLETNI